MPVITSIILKRRRRSRGHSSPRFDCYHRRSVRICAEVIGPLRQRLIDSLNSAQRGGLVREDVDVERAIDVLRDALYARMLRQGGFLPGNYSREAYLETLVDILFEVSRPKLRNLPWLLKCKLSSSRSRSSPPKARVSSPAGKQISNDSRQSKLRLIGVAALIVGVIIGLVFFAHYQSYESTDDAFHRCAQRQYLLQGSWSGSARAGDETTRR